MSASMNPVARRAGLVATAIGGVIMLVFGNAYVVDRLLQEVLPWIGMPKYRLVVNTPTWPWFPFGPAVDSHSLIESCLGWIVTVGVIYPVAATWLRRSPATPGTVFGVAWVATLIGGLAGGLAFVLARAALDSTITTLLSREIYLYATGWGAMAGLVTGAGAVLVTTRSSKRADRNASGPRPSKRTSGSSPTVRTGLTRTERAGVEYDPMALLLGTSR